MSPSLFAGFTPISPADGVEITINEESMITGMKWDETGLRGKLICNTITTYCKILTRQI